MSQYLGLSVAGYRAQSLELVDIATETKRLVKLIARRLAELEKSPVQDRCYLTIGRSKMEQGFRMLNRSIFRLDRVDLPNDGSNDDGEATPEDVADEDGKPSR